MRGYKYVVLAISLASVALTSAACSAEGSLENPVAAPSTTATELTVQESNPVTGCPALVEEGGAPNFPGDLLPTTWAKLSSVGIETTSNFPTARIAISGAVQQEGTTFRVRFTQYTDETDKSFRIYVLDPTANSWSGRPGGVEEDIFVRDDARAFVVMTSDFVVGVEQKTIKQILGIPEDCES